MNISLLLLSLACITPALGAKNETCTDDNGTIRQDGDSWRKECNTCKCDDGRISCTEVNCDNIGNGDKRCECINPFSGFDSHTGDPDVTCNRENLPFCYVDCEADCRDIRAARGRDRCFSNSACFQDIAPRIHSP